MRILIAEDDRVSRLVLENMLAKWGYDCIACCDGNQAWQVLENEENPPQLAIFDWDMPKLSGIDLCRKIRQAPGLKTTYILMLTSRDSTKDIVKGLKDGANDYLTKPFNKDELEARLIVGKRTLELQSELAGKVMELENSLSRVKQLQGLLPICAYCKKVRNDKNYWEQVEGYISKHSEARFSHGICPECYEKHLKKDLDELGNKDNN